jgi:hypothetical protein
LLSGVVLFLAESWLSWLCTSACFLGAACGARHHQSIRFTTGRFQVGILVPSPVAAGHHPCAQAQC